MDLEDDFEDDWSEDEDETLEMLSGDEDTDMVPPGVAPPVAPETISFSGSDDPETMFVTSLFSSNMLSCRSLAVVGPYHSGKSSICSLLGATLSPDVEESQSGMTLHPHLYSVMAADSTGKHYGLSLIDTPGHSEFQRDVLSVLDVVDGAVLVLDAVHGTLGITHTLIGAISRRRLPITLVINQVDRLITELQLPTNDVYHKLNHIVSGVNNMLSHFGTRPIPPSSVTFASVRHGWAFTLPAFPLSAPTSDPRLLWGDVFIKTPDDAEGGGGWAMTRSRTGMYSFAGLIAAPIAKVYSTCVAADPRTVNSVTQALGFTLSKQELRADADDLIHAAMARWLGHTALVDAIVEQQPSVLDAHPKLAARLGIDVRPGDVIAICPALMPNGVTPIAIARIIAGAVGADETSNGDMPENILYPITPAIPLTDVDSPIECGDIGLPYCGRLVRVSKATNGATVVIDGVSAAFEAPTLLVNAPVFERLQTIKSGRLNLTAYPDPCPAPALTVAVEALLPTVSISDAVEGLPRTHPTVTTQPVAGTLSDGYFISAPGELTLASALKALRDTAGHEVRASIPHAAIKEAPHATSTLPARVLGAGEGYGVGMITEPCAIPDTPVTPIDVAAVRSRAIAELEAGELTDFIGDLELGIDHLQATGLMAIEGGAALVNGAVVDWFTSTLSQEDAVPPECPTITGPSLRAVRRAFTSAVRAGPLVGQPISQALFTLTVDPTPADVTPAPPQVMLSLVTRAVHAAALLLASPRFIEPIAVMDAVYFTKATRVIDGITYKRRGQVGGSARIPATPLSVAVLRVPVLDVTGLEVDLRLAAGYCVTQLLRHEWGVMPSDPLSGVYTKPMERATNEGLAADVMSKLRARRGLGEIRLGKYFKLDALREMIEHRRIEGGVANLIVNELGDDELD